MNHQPANSPAGPRLRGVRVLPVLPVDTLRTWRGVDVRAGGWGSDLTLDPTSGGHVYLLADRGPNFDAPGIGVKGFVKPDFVPRIGRFRILDASLELDRIIEIHAPDGTRASGLPNPPGPGATGESAVDLERASLEPDVRGLDPEGLVALSDGGFWLAEEYGPSLIRIDHNGMELARHTPFAGAPPLPAVLAKRRPNRGFEGLALLNDGHTLRGPAVVPR